MYLGIDTSNYTSSVALVDDDLNIIADQRKLLNVEDRAKGLRQSDALFQHWANLPLLTEPVLKSYKKDIKAVVVSSRPRPYEDSYMPVFSAGINSARMIADALGVELLETTHQEGHFKAASLGNSIDFSKPTLCAHLSGGTLELVFIYKEEYRIVGGTKDISYGKLLDRLGVELGYKFPAGSAIDNLASLFVSNMPVKNPFCQIHMENGYLNISGLETQLINAIDKYPKEELAYYCMSRVAESFTKIIDGAANYSDSVNVLVSGGIASSQFLRNYCMAKKYKFGEPKLCTDNAVGVAATKGKKLWD